MRKLLIVLLLIFFSIPENYAEDNDCGCEPQKFIVPGSLINKTNMKVLLKNNKPPLFNCISAVRLEPEDDRYKRQMIRLCFADGSSKELPVTDIVAFEFNDIGGSGTPYSIPVLPVREYKMDEEFEETLNFLELTPMLGYGGKDESTREIDGSKVGFDNIYYGAELLVAPFGKFFGENLSLGLGGGIFLENSRMRFPLKGELRYVFGRGKSSNTDYIFDPSPCKFQDPANKDETTIDAPSGMTMAELPYDKYDPTVQYIEQRSYDMDAIRPYIFVEGGWIFDGSFTGAGDEPSANPEDYGQYLAGAGVGAWLWSWATVNLSYRYMRLNLRTECPECEEIYIVNINNVHSILLKIGFRLEW